MISATDCFSAPPCGDPAAVKLGYVARADHHSPAPLPPSLMAGHVSLGGLQWLFRSSIRALLS